MRFAIVLMLVTLSFISCKTEKQEEIREEVVPDVTFKENEKDFIITIQTKYGVMKAVLYDNTPLHKQNFIKLAKEGFYNDLLFHRVIENFMLQGGDPQSKGAEAGVPLGQGTPGYNIPSEFRYNRFHKKGALAAARQGDNVNPRKESNGSQFYIVQGQKMSMEQVEQMQVNYQALYKQFDRLLVDPEFQDLASQYNEIALSGDRAAQQEFILAQKSIIEEKYNVELDRLSDEQKSYYTKNPGTPQLDGAYTVFGEVIDGLDVIDTIAAIEKDGRDRPLDDVKMNVMVEEVSKSEIYKKYGYDFK